MQQGGGGVGGGPQGLGGDEKLGDLGIAEAASPISSRPPAAAEGGGGASGGNRWPRQETLALLQLRSDMDAAFRDAATLKAPLWEQISRKLGELGYNRSGKKCKEKFENVQKYYKRTKEGRGTGEDGKSYKFFTQLEALHGTHNASSSSSQLPPITTTTTTTTTIPYNPVPPITSLPPAPLIVPPPDQHNYIGINFSSDSSSSSEDEMEIDDNNNKKRKRSEHETSADNSGDDKMMEMFEGLMKQVMQKQEILQQNFLEALEKREQDRLIREEAWKRQDMARLAREHHLMAQERAASVSRDSAIVAFLQKITGQTIHLPQSQTPPPPPPPPPPMPVPIPEQQVHNVANTTTTTTISEIVTDARPEQQIVPVQDFTGGSEITTTTSSRWPKTEVLALIQLRSGMESRYQDVGPKGPLWEEISSGMRRMGYNRNAKRCKEKWENINKYYKKVKESGKKPRLEDSKTCPYFHELDALYRKKIIGNTSSSNVVIGSSSGIPGSLSEQEGQQLQVQQQDAGITNLESLKPEDMLKKLQQQPINGNVMEGFSNSDDILDEEDNYEEFDENEEYDDDDKTDEEMKMAYKIQFQRQSNVGSANGSGTASTSFMAMVQ